MSGQRCITTTKASIVSSVLAGSLILIACSDKAGDSSDSSATTTAGPTSGSAGGETTEDAHTDGTTDTTTTGASDTADPTTTTDDPTTESSTDPFIDPPDVTCTGLIPCSWPDCNTYEENCPEGQKCMPYENDGNSLWNATKCVDVTGAGFHGDPCTVVGTHVSGEDDCALHHMCWDVDLETNMGHCISFCDGSMENPSCDEPDTVCMISNDGVLNLCQPVCKPLLQDCPEGQGCYPLNDSYICVPTAVPDELGFEGDPYEFVNKCQPGFACIDANQLPNCMSDSCCAPFCDLTQQDPCPNPETKCIPVYEDNQNDPNVGFCGIMP